MSIPDPVQTRQSGRTGEGVLQQHNKECCNKVEELEAKNSVATKENYVTIEDEEERIEDCCDNVFYVTPFQPYVAT